MEEFLKALAAAGTVSLVVERVVAAVMAPIKARVKKTNPDYDWWWLIYLSWGVGSVLAFAAGINLLGTLLPTLNPTVGLVLTAVIVGGGANLIHDIFDKPAATTLTAISELGGTLSAVVSTPKPDSSK